MSLLLHPESPLCVNTELDLFTIPGTSFSYKDCQYVSYESTTSISDNGPIVFRIPKTDRYLDLNLTYLKLKFRIVKADGSHINHDDGDGHAVSMINSCNSFFSDVQVSFNEKIVSNDNGLYPLRCEIENTINYNSDTKTCSWMQCDIYAPDDAGKKDEIDPRKGAGGNSGLATRFEYVKNSKLVTAYTRLHVDVFRMDKVLLNNVDIQVKITRSKDSFALMSPDALPNYRIRIESAQLHIRTAEIDSSILVAHAETLETKTAKYHFTRSEMHSLNIPRGHRTITKDSLFLGEVPRAILACFVGDEAISGNYKKSPYNFMDYNLSYMGVSVNNIHVQNSPLILDSEGDGVEAYHAALLARGMMYKNDSFGIKRQHFKHGNFMCIFNISPELGDDHLNLTKRGSLKIELRFDKVLPFNVNLIILAVYDELLQVTKDRYIEIDF